MAWVPTYLGELPGDSWSLPSCCNDDGSIIYGASSASGSLLNTFGSPIHPVKWSGGIAHALGSLTPPLGTYGSEPSCCSPDGSLAGGLSIAGDGSFFGTPTVWDSSGTAHALIVPVGYGSGSVGFCENDVSLMDGWFGNIETSTVSGRGRGIYWAAGSPVPLAPVSPLTDSSCSGCARGLAGVAIGDDNSGADPGQQAAIWNSGLETRLGFLSDGTFSSASSIDNTAQNVVGSSGTSHDLTTLANVYWDSSHVIHDLGQNPGVTLIGAQPAYITPNGLNIFVNYQDSMSQQWVAFIDGSHVLHTLPGLCGTPGSQPTYQTFDQFAPGAYFYRPASDDGTRYVGFASDGSDTWGVIWINQVPSRLLPPPGLPPEFVQPMGISADGSTVFGFVIQNGVTGPLRAAKWTFNPSVPEPACPGPPPPDTFVFEAGDLWFSPTPFFVDLTNAANVAKFIDKNGCTVNLGPNGSFPFGYTPSVFLHVPTGGTADNWAANYGSGGPFILSGGDLTLASNMPCCGVPPGGNTPLQYKLLMTDLHGERGMVKWWTASQESPLIFIGTQELNSVLVAWGTDGSFVFPLFQNNQSILPKTVQSKLWARPGGYMLQKIMTRLWMLVQYYQSIFPNVTISVDTEAGNGTGNAVITFQPGVPIGPPAVTVMPPQEVAQQGVLTGLTITTIAGDLAIVSVSVQDQIVQYRG